MVFSKKKKKRYSLGIGHSKSDAIDQLSRRDRRVGHPWFIY